jgi:DtxR family manganese transport transcriptional regulator
VSPGKRKKPRSRQAKGAASKQANRASRSAEAQADGHRRTRQAHSTESAQDYVEVIADLIALGGEARVVDIARRLGVTPVTVVKTIDRLQRKGLVTTRPYRSIFLTRDGDRMASESKRRHRSVADFLEALGVAPKTAWSDAEGIEHHVSQETLSALETFTRKLRPMGKRRPSGGSAL